LEKLEGKEKQRERRELLDLFQSLTADATAEREADQRTI